MIRIRQLTKTFSNHPVLNDVSFSAAPGERIAIVGNNGAGKTTLMRVLSTYIPVTSGYGTIAGFDIFREAAAIRQIIGYLPEKTPLYNDMQVAEYLKFRGRLRQMNRQHLRSRLHEVLALCDMSQMRNSHIGSLSLGLRHRVALADALLHNPKVLLLDDPLAGCDPYQAMKLTGLMASTELGADRTLVFTSHSTETVRAVATRIIFLERGRVRADTTDVAALSRNPLHVMFGKWNERYEAAGEEKPA